MNLNQNNVRAFTLIEMILAIGISALVLVAIGSVLVAALNLRNATQSAVDEATPVDLALSVMRRDLQCAVTPTNGTSGVLSSDFKVGTVTSSGVSQPVAIEMFTATGALNENEPWGDIQRVTYELKNPTDRSTPGRDLIRSVTRNLLPVATPDVADQWMMSGVQSIQFSCFDGTQWSDTWDTTALTSSDTNLPVAVRVQIQLVANPAQPVEIAVPIDSQSRSNVTLNTASTGG